MLFAARHRRLLTPLLLALVLLALWQGQERLSHQHDDGEHAHCALCLQPSLLHAAVGQLSAPSVLVAAAPSPQPLFATHFSQISLSRWARAPPAILPL
ncbi:hypothetical protein [Atopomonas sediminilitoris]|uniref:hypothetical protein n=1 Tax=Atopomonas sediminilitoris TaxID=2919919 RepID=UPI001F4DF119|nr:hypothetical protein [Atopomonas sediminilitoris]MCJ8168455.1 hypothetical protein [Atopomonas sediminilitoris]